MILNGFFNNDGMSPANERHAVKTSILSDPLDTGEVKGKVISHRSYHLSIQVLWIFRFI